MNTIKYVEIIKPEQELPLDCYLEIPVLREITMVEFETEYFRLAGIHPSYRYGQHFLNTFVKDSSSYPKLWNEKDVDIARKEVYTLLADWCWDLTSLPVYEENWED